MHTDMVTRPPAPDLVPAAITEPVRELAMGFIPARCLHLAAEWDIATRLGDAERSLDSLAEEVGAAPEALGRVLRLLACIGVFEEAAADRFRNSDRSRCLASDHPRSVRSWVRLYGSPETWTCWGALEASVRAGKPAFELLHGEKIFDALDRTPGRAGIFDDAMVNSSRLSADAVIGAYDFSAFGCVVDVGGGKGTMVRALLERHERLRGVVADLPRVAEGASTFLGALVLAGRARFEPADFFVHIPAGGDAYLLQRVLHDWDDEHCVRILRNVAAVMAPTAKLLVCEAVRQPKGGSAYVGMMDVHMMVMTHGGRERTAGEFASLLGHAGLTLERIVPTASALSVLEATHQPRSGKEIAA